MGFPPDVAAADAQSASFVQASNAVWQKYEPAPQPGDGDGEQ